MFHFLAQFPGRASFPRPGVTCLHHRRHHLTNLTLQTPPCEKYDEPLRAVNAGVQLFVDPEETQMFDDSARFKADAWAA